ncbi:receptor-like protein EIX2 isoform X1 [Prosopis cineraria]|uniref:receptor-like protein EIX2 isoform X1 n=1 Tax=Prosopis cineraria TaxID=364024 RepID=UPI0024106F22|nr:receptor-like protein EIX2 isoform X1 [Prosopis cineraria]
MFIVMKEIEKLLKSFREVLKILGSCSPLGLAITIVVAGLEFTAINSQVLQMEHNRLSGELPRCWTQWTKHLKMIILHSNNIGGNIPPQVCQLSDLHVLDLAYNKLSGSIPKCLGNIIAMGTITSGDLFFKNYSYGGRVIGRDSMSTYMSHRPFFHKGPETEYWDNAVKFILLIDLSNNGLSEFIPQELFSLIALLSLDLSHNHLMGRIADGIEHMKSLEFLDLSWNKLSGEIPQSLGNLSFLIFMNLSYNNFNGRIPLGHLQSFDASSYISNPELYGPPLTKSYSQGEIPNVKKQIVEDSEDDFTKWFHIGKAFGFAYGFWGVCFSLFFFRTWRLAYFRFLNKMNDRIYVFVVLKTKWFH